MGMVLLAYSAWLLGSFFVPQIQAFAKGVTEQYPVAKFLLPDIFSRPDFLLIGLFFGSLYFLAGINIILLRYNGRVGSAFLLFSIWMFFLFFVLLKLKEGLGGGFPPQITDNTKDDAILILCLSIPSIIALPFLAGDELEQ